MPELTEIYQKRFHCGPTWGPDESHPDDAQRFRFTLQLPDDQVVEGSWELGKAKAKRSCLQKALELLGAIELESSDQKFGNGVAESSPCQVIASPSASAAAEPFVDRSTPCNPSRENAFTMPELTEMYQKRFHVPITWCPGEIDPHNQQRFRFTLQLPDGQAAEGDWALGKPEAKRLCLLKALKLLRLIESNDN